MTEQEAIKALKLEGGIEITGRAKRCADFCMGLDIAIKALEEIQQYREIGTVEECREAMERKNEKKVIERKEIKDFEGRIYAIKGSCPRCGYGGIKSTDTLYCPYCGQKLDWSDEENG